VPVPPSQRFIFLRPLRINGVQYERGDVAELPGFGRTEHYIGRRFIQAVPWTTPLQGGRAVSELVVNEWSRDVPSPVVSMSDDRALPVETHETNVRRNSRSRAANGRRRRARRRQTTVTA
jgi:hypothetical protein